MRERKDILNVIRLIFPRMVKSCPWLFVLSGLLGIANSVCMGLLIYRSQDLYDGVLQAINGVTDKGDVISIALGFGCLTIVNQILNGLSVYTMNVMFDIIKRDLTYDLHKKVDRLKVISYESETMLNQLQMAMRGRDESIFLLFICFTPLTCHLPLYIILGNYLHMLNPQLVWAVLIIFLPICISYIYKIRAKSNLVDRVAEPKREMDYYYRCITNREYFKETRLLGAIPFFKNLFEESMYVVNHLEIKFQTKTLRIDLAAKLITVLGYGVVLYLLIDNVVIGAITVGAFAAALNGIGLLFDEMKELVGDDIGENIGSVGAIKNLIDFMELPESYGADDREESESDKHERGIIRLENVSFKYPHSKEYALKGINLEIMHGEKIALVGENGSGKTTLIKILLGLYEPSEGKIHMPGEMQTSAVFQDFKKYEMPLKENIAISDVMKSVDEERIRRICEKTGVVTDINTKLGVKFGGIDLSGGQWQRIAIARGLYKKHNLIVLDEPTAAIDPLEESAIYEQFKDIVKDNTAVLVTHRIGSAQIADRIIVMSRGSIIDSGTHQELLKRCEEYSNMYYAQADLYCG